MELKKADLPENGPECDADVLFMVAHDAATENELASIQEPGAKQMLSRAHGRPLLFYIGRVSTGDTPDAMIMEGRSAVKERLSRINPNLYKAARKLMMSYKMGEEVPVIAIGADETIRLGVVPLGKECV